MNKIVIAIVIILIIVAAGAIILYSSSPPQDKNNQKITNYQSYENESSQLESDEDVFNELDNYLEVIE